MNQKPARTRFAPSPTGYMHVGGVRTALFAWLIARQTGGKFILRLEDTDKAREVEGSGKHIAESLAWLDIDWDEGVYLPNEGDKGPYLQSERLAIYKEWAEKLIAKGRAYVDPYTPEELQTFRDEAKAAKKPFLFRNHRPADISAAWDGTKPLRFKSDPKAYTWHDAVMGDLSAGEEAVDDYIIMKSDGYPTYNFAHIVDDHLMECTHVIRSQEFIASVPKFLNLYEALEIERPVLATVPFVMGPDGKKKLSKRDGAKDILDYKNEGYLPETILNFLATLGWNDGTEKEVFSVEELIEKFSLDRVQRSGARFDEQRLVWLNGAHIRGMELGKLYGLVSGDFAKFKGFWPESAVQYPQPYKMQVLGLVQERLKFFSELPELTYFFFEEPGYNPKKLRELIEGNKQLRKVEMPELTKLLITSRDALEATEFSKDALTEALNKLLETTGQKPAILFSLIRTATTWAPSSPALADSLEVLTKQRSLERIEKTIEILGTL
jgi:glutamyl-tRNA synthetase